VFEVVDLRREVDARSFQQWACDAALRKVVEHEGIQVRGVGQVEELGDLNHF
jgi:hypothetical protein